MTFHEDEKKGGRRRKAEPKPETENVIESGKSTPSPSRRRLPSSNVGDALKSAYQRALDEDIPPEMLDLLGKLG